MRKMSGEIILHFFCLELGAALDFESTLCTALRPTASSQLCIVLCFMQLCIAAGALGLFRLPRARQPNPRRRTALDTNSTKHCRRLDPTRTPTTHRVAPPVVQPLGPARSWTTQAVRSQTESQYSSSNSNSGLLSRISTGLNFYQPS